jgi:hypothetical protein
MSREHAEGKEFRLEVPEPFRETALGRIEFALRGLEFGTVTAVDPSTEDHGRRKPAQPTGHTGGSRTSIGRLHT